MKIRYVFSTLFLTAIPAFAGAAVIDFEELTAKTYTNTVSSKGYVFASSIEPGALQVNSSDGGPLGALPGSQSLTWCSSFCGGIHTLSLSAINGQNFSLTSLDYSQNKYQSGGGLVNMSMWVEAYRGGNLMANLEAQVFSSEWVWTELLFDAAFSDIDTIKFYTTNSGYFNDFVLDNIQVSNVPIPAATWLFGSALIGLAGIKRKK